MGLFHRKSAWERVTDPIASAAPKGSGARSGLTAVGTTVALTVGSAVVSAYRHRKDSQ
ncbi:hypothetical protein PZ938_01995 [Luteipulveratus sp. YIM 133132]|uniref:Gram-positive cocci surface proteins LPxTG domain-containing protein n=1 Tax=Luteipulveratus flavus TaxID=3031728 RepID=A0ABT6CB03_9MICO|nr:MULTISPECIES: hypothetical protein [unclassified Luteipulveratus]MDE9364365.1 hypothetical protein [Luteipulveratus sp. YIM 133132]MDF8266077.1 hypothetical protein [Luteipulveratus sp. YIM 133296]